VAVAVWLPGYLRAHAGGASRVDLEPAPATVGAVLERLWAIHPGVRDRVVTERGEVRPHVNVFVGAESIRVLGGLAAAVRDGDEVSIIPAVSGG
jgi:molybdopterin converting factor small subunit